MRAALLLFGQARATDRIEANPGVSSLSVIEKYKLDVYCCFWDEPEAHKSIELFKPKSHALISPDVFPAWKAEWWKKWSREVGKVQDVSHRWPRFNNEILTSRDNTLRYWVLAHHGIKLLSGGYDLVVASRPDVGFAIYPEIEHVLPDQIVVQDRWYFSYIDHIFWGASASMQKLLNWDKMIAAMVKAEIMGKYGRRPMSLARGGRWLSGENTLALTIQLSGFTLAKRQFKTFVIRRK